MGDAVRVAVHTPAGQTFLAVPESDARWAVVVERAQAREARMGFLARARELEERARSEVMSRSTQSRANAKRFRELAVERTGMTVAALVWSYDDAKRVSAAFRRPAHFVHIGRVMPVGESEEVVGLPPAVRVDLGPEEALTVSRMREALNEQERRLGAALEERRYENVAERSQSINSAMFALGAVERGEYPADILVPLLAQFRELNTLEDRKSSRA